MINLSKALKILKTSHLETQKAYFYLYKSNLDFEMIYPACALVASKSTDLKLRDILNVFYYISTEIKLEIDKEYWELRDGLLNAERILLRAIGFQIEVDDLMLDLCCYCEDHRVDRLTWQTAIAILNSCFELKEVVMKSEIVKGRSDARQVTLAVVAVANLFVKEKDEEIDRIRKVKRPKEEDKAERRSKSKDAHEELIKLILDHLSSDHLDT